MYVLVMSAHKWVLSMIGTKLGRDRIFRCERCGAGPIVKDILSSKNSIMNIAKELGYSNDCNVEVVKKIMGS